MARQGRMSPPLATLVTVALTSSADVGRRPSVRKTRAVDTVLSQCCHVLVSQRGSRLRSMSRLV